MLGVDVTDIARRYWVVWLLGGVVLLETLIFYGFLTARQQVTDHKFEVMRRDLCALFANPDQARTPPKITREINQARRDLAPAGNPDGCQPSAPPHPTVTPAPTPEPVRTVLLVPVTPGSSLATHAASPAPSRTASPRATRKPSHPPTPKPSPSPTPACSLRHPLKCLERHDRPLR